MQQIDRSVLEEVKTKIEKMNKAHQLDVLSSLAKKSNVPISENQNGSFVNLSSLKTSDVVGLKKFVEYVMEQENTLEETERHKKELKDEFF